MFFSGFFTTKNEPPFFSTGLDNDMKTTTVARREAPNTREARRGDHCASTRTDTASIASASGGTSAVTSSSSVAHSFRASLPP